jgi:hypothetical protein
MHQHGLMNMKAFQSLRNNLAATKASVTRDMTRSRYFAVESSVAWQEHVSIKQERASIKQRTELFEQSWFFVTQP